MKIHTLSLYTNTRVQLYSYSPKPIEHVHVMPEACSHICAIINATPLNYTCQTPISRDKSISYLRISIAERDTFSCWILHCSITHLTPLIYLMPTGIFYWQRITLISTWKSIYIHNEIWNEFMCPFLNFNEERRGRWIWKLSMFLKHVDIHFMDLYHVIEIGFWQNL